MGKGKRNRPKGWKDLTYRQRLFALEYIKDLNGTQAAIRAGYDDTCANEMACTNLHMPAVKKEIDRLYEELAARKLITAEMILLELLAIARIDPSEAFDAGGSVKDLKDMPVTLRKCISSIEVEEEFDKLGHKKTGYTKKIRFWNKNDALNTLAKHLKLITDNHNNLVLPGGKLVFQDIKLAGRTAEDLFNDIHSRLAMQHEEKK
ncbi:MAG TPA: hypothetical protein DCL42_10385 [Deltaproteobacteria bacterium]|nr:hypothetical protein [Deltaproteobacteria bacterium]